jgi:hypothetical protein
MSTLAAPAAGNQRRLPLLLVLVLRLRLLGRWALLQLHQHLLLLLLLLLGPKSLQRKQPCLHARPARQQQLLAMATVQARSQGLSGCAS